MRSPTEFSVGWKVWSSSTALGLASCSAQQVVSTSLVSLKLGNLFIESKMDGFQTWVTFGNCSQSGENND